MTPTRSVIFALVVSCLVAAPRLAFAIGCDTAGCSNLCTFCDSSSNTCKPIACSSPPQCHTSAGATCSGGVCSYPVAGGSCNDGNSCTFNDTCSGGSCGGSPISCAPTECQQSASCNGTSSCAIVNKTDTTPCGSAPSVCSGQDTCLTGACVPNHFAPGTAIAGSPCTECDGAGGVRNKGAGTSISACTECDGAGAVRNKTNGTACGSPTVTTCSAADSCQAGACSSNDAAPGTSVTACTECDGVGGVRNKTNGTACGSATVTACSAADTCQAGACNANNAAAGAAIAGSPCTECDGAGGARNKAASLSVSDCTECDGGGAVRNKTDGVDCTLAAQRCTIRHCQAGTCQMVNAVTCVTQDCHAPPHCDDATGNCVGDTPLSGTSCGGTGCFTAATCLNGVCPGQPKDCSSFNAVCMTGVCDATNGDCKATQVMNDTPCTLADKCKLATVCSGGSCQGADKVCPPPGVCVTATCNPTTGDCESGNQTAGVACDPGNDCVQQAACDGSGHCVGSSKVDGTFCRLQGCDVAACAAGACVCGSAADMSVTVDPGVDMAGGGTPTSGCDAGGAADAPWALVALLAALALVARRRGRSSRLLRG